MHFVKEIINVKPYKLTLKFEDESVRVVDLEEKIKLWSKSEPSIFRFLLNPENFIKVKLHEEQETVFWENGIDFCPDMLYEWSLVSEMVH